MLNSYTYNLCPKILKIIIMPVDAYNTNFNVYTHLLCSNYVGIIYLPLLMFHWNAILNGQVQSTPFNILIMSMVIITIPYLRMHPANYISEFCISVHVN
jgi:hypothetical protein